MRRSMLPRFSLPLALGATACLPLALFAGTTTPQKSVGWQSVGNDAGGQRYSELDQINRRNVKQLELAWTYSTGETNGNTIECTPIVVDNVMYVTTPSPKVKIVALDASTGKELWKHDPKIGEVKSRIVASGGVNRGLAYWGDPRPTGPKRILFGAADGRLIALDAATGKPAPEFGENGIDLRAGSERDLANLSYGITSAPAVFEDNVIVGFSVGEGPGAAAPGDVRAFNIRTGKQAWRFRTVPAPGEFGHDTWSKESWKERGGANAWGGFTIDDKRGIVFCGTGSPSFDFFGGDRPGTNLFGNCVLAIDARTGLRLWHFQVVRHDLWDYDNPCPPVVTTITQGLQKLDVVAQVTKTGNCWILNRLNGKPVFGAEERAVPPSITIGEAAQPKQIFPLKPPAFSKQHFGPNDVTNISKEASDYVLKKLLLLRSGAIFTPPSLRGTVTTPGFHGGATWSGASVDPETGILYVNNNNVPNVTTLTQDADGKWGHAGYGRFEDQDKYPAIKPPWGQLTAIDLNEGNLLWQSVLGEYPELTAKGVPQTGTESFGGTIVTKGGLVFIGGTKDEKMHAFDKTTGKLVWDYKLPAGGYATPCTYMVNGKQYVVIAAGGGGKLGTKTGDKYVAFALK
jgi:quinoprotein glucose dehydrogenase